MQDNEIIRYHSKRNLAELNAGLTAQTLTASRAHLHLSSLHLERARTLQPKTSIQPLPKM
jgi:hypothetical protein